MSQVQVISASIQSQVNWNHYIDLAAFVILVYDYGLTLNREIQCFWKWHTTGFGSVLFYVNRYLILLGSIPYFYLYPSWAARTINHDAVAIYLEALLFAGQIVIIILFILRLYALYGASVRVAVFLSTVAIGVVVNASVQLFLENESNDSSDDLSPALVDQVGSLQGYTVSEALHLVYTWIGVFVFDVCVFSLTLWKTWRMRRDRIPGGIGSIIMRDGLMYFVVIALINLVNILVFALGGVYTRDLMPVFATVLASVMMSRMLLNMRESQFDENSIHHIPTQQGPVDDSQLSTDLELHVITDFSR